MTFPSGAACEQQTPHGSGAEHLPLPRAQNRVGKGQAPKTQDKRRQRQCCHSNFTRRVISFPAGKGFSNNTVEDWVIKKKAVGRIDISCLIIVLDK